MSSSFVLMFSGDAAYYAVVRILRVRIINPLGISANN